MNDMTKKQNKYITFKSGGEYFGLKIEYVKEIIVYQEITQVPETEDYVKGLINLRGKIIPVIDVRIRFKQEPKEYTDRTCIIIVNVQDLVVGLIVEQIAEVVEIKPENISEPPSLGDDEKTQNRYICAIGTVGESVKLLLDPDKLLKDDEITMLEEMTEESVEEGSVEEKSSEKESAEGVTQEGKENA